MKTTLWPLTFLERFSQNHSTSEVIWVKMFFFHISGPPWSILFSKFPQKKYIILRFYEKIYNFENFRNSFSISRSQTLLHNIYIKWIITIPAWYSYQIRCVFIIWIIWFLSPSEWIWGSLQRLLSERNPSDVSSESLSVKASLSENSVASSVPRAWDTARAQYELK